MIKADEKKTKVLKDGEKITVCLNMMDALSLNVTQSAIKDGNARTLPMTDADRARRMTQIVSYENKLCSAWRDPAPAITQAAADAGTGVSLQALYDQEISQRWRHG